MDIGSFWGLLITLLTVKKMSGITFQNAGYRYFRAKAGFPNLKLLFVSKCTLNIRFLRKSKC